MGGGEVKPWLASAAAIIFAVLRRTVRMIAAAVAAGGRWLRVRWPLWAVIALVGAIFLILIETQVARDHERASDRVILTEIVATYAYAVVVLVIFTERWRAVILGLLVTTTADALFYGVFLGGEWGRHFAPAAFDLVRACLIVGGPTLSIGLTLWVIRRFGHGTDRLGDDEAPTNGRGGPV